MLEDFLLKIMAVTLLMWEHRKYSRVARASLSHSRAKHTRLLTLEAK